MSPGSSAAVRSRVPATRAARLIRGQFDTPPHVADLGFQAAVRSGRDRIWEPTCGPGSFLHAALRAGHPADRLWGTEIDGDRLAAARSGLPGVTLQHADLFDLPPTDRPFDAIVGNPPFVRPERLSAADRARILAAVARSTGFTPSAKADLAVLALLHCTTFLAPGGRLSFVMPNTWMDADFGVDVRRFLLQDHRVLRIIESREEPWFPEVSVNTVIVVLERTQEPRETTFTQLHAGGERNHVGVADAARWTIPLRAPASWWAVHESAPLVALGDALDIGYGTKVGIAPFFTPRVAPDIEPRWRRPFLRTLRGVHRYTVREADTAGVLLDFSADPTAAADPEQNPLAANWIASGADGTNRSGVRFPDVRSVQHHDPWFAVREVRTGPILLPQFRSERHYILANPDGVPVNNSAWWGRWRGPIDPDVAGGLLNCTWMALAAEVLGRTNLGEGLLTLYGPDLKALPIPACRGEDIGAAYRQLRDRHVLPLKAELDQPDRAILDLAVGAALGLPEDLTQAIRDDALRLMTERLTLAARLRGARRAYALLGGRNRGGPSS